jgi:hypothetical protein
MVQHRLGRKRHGRARATLAYGWNRGVRLASRQHHPWRWGGPASRRPRRECDLAPSALALRLTCTSGPARGGRASAPIAPARRALLAAPETTAGSTCERLDPLPTAHTLKRAYIEALDS